MPIVLIGLFDSVFSLCLIVCVEVFISLFSDCQNILSHRLILNKQALVTFNSYEIF